MPYIESAPDAAEAVTEMIEYHQKHIGSRYNSDYYTTRETVGRMATVGGAVVEVQAVAKFDAKRRYGQDDERSVQVGAVAKCHGWGCSDPSSGEALTEPVALDAAVYETSH